MPRLSNANARVQDPVLSRAARGYRQPGLVYTALFPEVPVMLSGGRRIQFQKEEFVTYDTLRGPGGDAKVLEFGHTGVKFALDPHSLDGKLPIETAREMNAIPEMNAQLNTSRRTIAALQLGIEREGATLATDNTNYAAANKIALAGAARWDTTTCLPAADIQIGQAAIRSGIGVRANTMIIGGSVYDQLRNNADVVDRVGDLGDRLIDDESRDEKADVHPVHPGSGGRCGIESRADPSPRSGVDDRANWSGLAGGASHVDRPTRARVRCRPMLVVVMLRMSAGRRGVRQGVPFREPRGPDLGRRPRARRHSSRCRESRRQGLATEEGDQRRGVSTR